MRSGTSPRKESDFEEIVEKVLLMQANAATQQHRPLGRGTHAKGVCARARFEVFDVTIGRDPVLAARLARGIFAKPGVYPAVVRFANADPNVNSDFKADVRSLSFSVDLTREGARSDERPADRISRCKTQRPCPSTTAPAFLATMKVLTASNPAAVLWSLPFEDKLRVLQNAHAGRVAGAPDNQTLPATALLEHGPVSSRTHRRCEVFGHAVSGQSGASSAKEQSERLCRTN